MVESDDFQDDFPVGVSVAEDRRSRALELQHVTDELKAMVADWRLILAPVAGKNKLNKMAIVYKKSFYGNVLSV